MKKILFVFIFFLFFLTNLNAQYGWTNVLNQSYTIVNKTFFLDENTGFVVGGFENGSYSMILKTINGGTNWTSQYGSFGSPELNSVFFVNNLTGYIVGGDYYSSPVFFKTSNQGINWVTINLGYSNNNFFDISFINASTGIITGGGIILRSTNGGNNWYQISNIPNVNIYKIDFAKSGSGLCYAVGGNSCILRSSNSGQSWEILNLNSTNDTIFVSISIINDSICYISSGNVIKKTTNRGNSWINLPGIYGYGGRTYFFSDTCGFIATAGIFKTTNGGINWIFQESPTGVYWYDLYFLNHNFGIALATQQSIYNGLIYRTTTGGNGPPTAPSNLYCTRKYGVNRLSWSDNSLTETGFKIQRCNISDSLWLELTSLPANTTSYNDSNSTANVKYRIYTYNEFGNSPFSNVAIPVVLNIEKQLKVLLNLLENYPNPFNPTTTIRFSIPENDILKIKNGIVKLKVYNILGKEIATLVNEKLQPGTYEVKFDVRLHGQGTNLPSGVYYYRIETDSYSETKKMVLIK